jgi:hypothetical protein
MKAWPTANHAALGSFFGENTIYHDVPREPVTGRTAIVATFAQFMSMSAQVDVEGPRKERANAASPSHMTSRWSRAPPPGQEWRGRGRRSSMRGQ